MSDEDRIELMILVKEGKITMEEAVERVSVCIFHAVKTDLQFQSVKWEKVRKWRKKINYSIACSLPAVKKTQAAVGEMDKLWQSS